MWSSEPYKVSKVIGTKPITYILRDMKNEEILHGFYEYELQTVKNGIYQIEKILRSRTRKVKRQLLVRRLGYNSDFYSWIAKEDVHNAQ